MRDTPLYGLLDRGWSETDWYLRCTMRDLEDHYGPLVTSTDNTVRSLDPAVALVPVN